MNQATLSLVAQFDDLMRADTAFANHLSLDGQLACLFRSHEQVKSISADSLYEKDAQISDLRDEVKKLRGDNSLLKRKLEEVRKSFFIEQKQRELTAKKYKAINLQLDAVRSLVSNDPSMTKFSSGEQIMKYLRVPGNCNLIDEGDTTENSGSELDYDKSEEDLDDTLSLNATIVESKASSSTTLNEDVLVIENTHFIKQSTKPLLRSESVIEKSQENHTPFKPIISVPNLMNAYRSPSGGTLTKKILSTTGLPKHAFATKRNFVKLMNTEKCSACTNKFKAFEACLKCTTCLSIIHTECRATFSKECLPTMSKSKLTLRRSCQLTDRLIADYCQKECPNVPTFLTQIFDQIEKREKHDSYLCRTRDKSVVNELYDKAMKVKTHKLLSLDNYAVPVLCDVVRHFFEQLSEKLTTPMLWRDFAMLAKGNLDVSDEQTEECMRLIDVLHEANKHTLAKTIVHIHRVSKFVDNGLKVLAEVFAPLLVGHSVRDHMIIEMNRVNEKPKQLAIMKMFLSLPENKWHQILINAGSDYGNATFVESKRRSLGGTLKRNAMMTPSK